MKLNSHSQRDVGMPDRYGAPGSITLIMEQAVRKIFNQKTKKSNNKIVKDNDPALLYSSSSTSKYVFVHCF